MTVFFFYFSLGIYSYFVVKKKLQSRGVKIYTLHIIAYLFILYYVYYYYYYAPAAVEQRRQQAQYIRPPV